MKISLQVNDCTHELTVETGERLVETLRAQLELTGTKVACGIGECGACTVLIDGQSRLACLTLTLTVRGSIRTIEGIGDEVQDLRRAFAEEGGFQCGFCTPGQIANAVGILETASPELGPEELVRALDGNLCRCTGYRGILRAVRRTQQERTSADGGCATRPESGGMPFRDRDVDGPPPSQEA